MNFCFYLFSWNSFQNLFFSFSFSSLFVLPLWHLTIQLDPTISPLPFRLHLHLILFFINIFLIFLFSIYIFKIFYISSIWLFNSRLKQSSIPIFFFFFLTFHFFILIFPLFHFYSSTYFHFFLCLHIFSLNFLSNYQIWLCVNIFKPYEKSFFDKKSNIFH